MKVAYLTAGAAGMYCGSCLNDNMLARTLGKRGVDVALIPTYTPIRTDEEDVSMDQVFFGGINVYLQQKFALFRRAPAFFDKILNSKPLLKLASRMSGSTNARMLGELTVAVLEGDHGPLHKEVEKLVSWLEADFQPDVVHLTNAMFVGLAGRLKARLGCVVTCGLPGEDLFLDGLIQPYRDLAMAALRRGAQDVDAFTAPSAYYQAHMVTYMDVPPARVQLVNLGLDLDGQQRFPARPRGDEPFTIGFLGRRAPEKGLHLLLDAFIELAQRVGRERVYLRVAGYLAAQDKDWYNKEVAKIHKAGLADRVDWVGEVDGEGKETFFQSIHAFSLPASYKEPKGRSVLEAMAHGVAVVQPAHGTFPRMIEDTGGGLLVSPNDVPALAEGLQRLMDHDDERLRMAASGCAAVRERYTAEAMADNILTTWNGVLKNARLEMR